MGVLLTLSDDPPPLLFELLSYEFSDAVNSLCAILDFWGQLSILAIPCFLLVLFTLLMTRHLLEPWARSVLWSFVLLRLTIPLACESPISVQNFWNLFPSQQSNLRDAERDWMLSIQKQPNSYSTFTSDEINQWTRLRPRSLSKRLTDVFPDLVEILHLWWIAGAFTLAAGSFVAFMQLMRWKQQGVDCLDANCLEILSEGCRRFGLRTMVRLRIAHQLNCPMIVDWYRPVILLPEDFASLPETQQRLVIWHGLARICRLDSFASFFLFTGALFQWWNPLFWWTASYWRLEREAACRELLFSRLDTEHLVAWNDVIQRWSGKPSNQIWLAKWFPTVGFVILANGPSALGQGLAGLPVHRVGRCRHWGTCSILFLCGVACLTVLPEPTPFDNPIHLPAGVTWEEPIRTHADVSQTYELGPCLDRLQLDSPSISRRSQIEEIRKAVSRLLRPWGTWDDSKVTQSVLDHYDSRIENEQLSVDASSEQHDLIARMISSWLEHGRRRIHISCQYWSVESELDELLPMGGGRVINANSASDRFRRISDTRNQPGGWAQSGTASSWPLFMRPVTDVEWFCLYHKEFGDARMHRYFTPEVDLADGESTRVAMESNRLYGTGLTAKDSNAFERTKSTVGDIESVEGAVHTLGAELFLQLHVHLRDVSDFEERGFQNGSNTSTIQVPCERFLSFEITTVVKDESNLLVVPLVRHPQNGRLLLYLVSCRFLTPEDDEVELLEVPRTN